MSDLEIYIKENPGEFLDIGETISGKVYVRPQCWCGVWENSKLVRGNSLALFSTKEEAKKTLISLGYKL